MWRPRVLWGLLCPEKHGEVCLGILEARAETSAMQDVYFHLRKKKMAWMSTYETSRKMRQGDIRIFSTRSFIFYKKLENVSCEYDRVNSWNSTLHAAWYIRHVRIIIWFLWTKRTIWLLILSSTQNISFARVLCFILMKDIGRWLPWMLPGSTGRFSITILCTDTI